MNIQLKSLRLVNFKGIRDLNIDFDQVTNLYGDNATGKTTIFDAFLWLLFGKNSQDEKSFEIKTLNLRNQPLHKLDHEVIGMFEIDGVETILRRVYREDWVKPRGKLEEELKGHTQEYYWNDVPLQAGEYSKKVAGICDETVFKLLTNTAYFNSLKWAEKRAVRIKIAGESSLEELAAGDPEFQALMANISGKSFAEYKRQLIAAKKNLKDQLAEIPTRIQEANRAMPEEIDYSVIEKKIAEKQGEINAIDTGLISEAEAAKAINARMTDKINEQHRLKTQLQSILFKIKTDITTSANIRLSNIQQKKAELRSKEANEFDITSELKQIEDRIVRLNLEQEVSRKEWEQINSEQFKPHNFIFDESNCTCPTCNQALPADIVVGKRELLEKNFNESEAFRKKQFIDGKQAKLDANNNAGLTRKSELERLKARKIELQNISTGITTAILRADIAEREAQHNTFMAEEDNLLNKAITDNAEIASLTEQINLLEEEIKLLQQPASKTTLELKEKKQVIAYELDSLNKQLATKEIQAAQKARIEELERQERDFAQQLADKEKEEFTILRFEKAQMDQLEARVNSMFKFVQFKMFEKTIEGNESPNCIALINGVPYSDANNAAKINAGLDIIRVLSDFYKITAPIFIDNAEGVTRLLPVESQIIRLIVSELEKKLLIITAPNQELAKEKYETILWERQSKELSQKVIA